MSPSTRTLSGLGDKLKFRFLEGTFDRTVTFLLAQVLGIPTVPTLFLVEAVEFQIEGGAPQKPLTVDVAYSESGLEGRDESLLRLWRIKDGEGILVPGSRVDPDRNLVTADVTEPGVYAVGIDVGE